MKKFILPIFSISILVSLSACSSIKTKSEDNFHISSQQHEKAIKSYFDEAQTQGVIIIKEGKNLSTYGNALARANKEYVPASTFKMLNALIGLENHKATTNEIFKWDGKKRTYPMWEKDMTLGEAMALSAVPVYQELARRTGLELMQKEVKRVNFGNTNIGTQVDNFWLVGPLKITPVQEVNFADDLAHNRLPFKLETQEEVKKMLLIKEVNGSKIYAKSGWRMGVTPQVGWLTGWVEQANGKKIPFSLNLEMKEGMSGSIRNEITYKSLENLGII
ncbi:OXA-24 family carbapenem-hydrolyzing class D beta-lactamase [Acinetobacter baumannii]|uniref:OXA-24 family carbapenem-hydrolyzing class D beta-lactamase OXA-1040 n=1 Tax=Acinetobacter baumannii TaxID=470 RepID=UPI001DCA107F|nr:OXA-24 family carbapenem-hydrolyzing class D beta-lactamase OXA-1040 [Acinetobacter baumannii]EKU9014263.1 OXA-24 family carbapenem-hydrolyzing class D beta-lactamase [Acinetobacter baumannii]EKU9014775.1 OXA-24 family carbapenem-hydrolyzing class D beta-lactamase [Acinetobacter baumannii]ELH2204312.1 OXA-24 family carbapenem-hydrolyzing class D beta-lactamase [Acinetobacter baumannii]ELH2204433.1 OXA-24 family carbapenem-hydrolyzing class D beta-lactamase [Acinetobacter baumannii]ELY313842